MQWLTQDGLVSIYGTPRLLEFCSDGAGELESGRIAAVLAAVESQLRAAVAVNYSVVEDAPPAALTLFGYRMACLELHRDPPENWKEIYQKFSEEYQKVLEEIQSGKSTQYGLVPIARVASGLVGNAGKPMGTGF